MTETMTLEEAVDTYYRASATKDEIDAAYSVMLAHCERTLNWTNQDLARAGMFSDAAAKIRDLTARLDAVTRERDAFAQDVRDLQRVSDAAIEQMHAMSRRLTELQGDAHA